jgi:methylenetetrahydrofolate reductase (NADPH)
MSSDDEVYGWGPRGGYVFQKAFVEFFCTKEDVDILEERIRSRGQGWVTFFAANMMVSLSRSTWAKGD